jgi:hypothetical protein
MKGSAIPAHVCASSFGQIGREPMGVLKFALAQRGLLACAVALLVLVATAPVYAVEGTPIPRDPRPNFAAFQFLVGSWTCMVDSSRRPHPFATTVTTSIDPNGYWMTTKTITGKVPWNPIEITNIDSITYDPTRMIWLDIGMDDYGAYDVSSSTGWNNASIVWNEVAYPKLHGVATQTPRTMTKVNDDKTITSQSFSEASGHHVTVTTTCIRAT